jgi:hypothetical protein
MTGIIWPCEMLVYATFVYPKASCYRGWESQEVADTKCRAAVLNWDASGRLKLNKTLTPDHKVVVYRTFPCIVWQYHISKSQNKTTNGWQAIEQASDHQRKYTKSNADFYKLVMSTASSPKSSLLEANNCELHWSHHIQLVPKPLFSLK